jgi:hypothetical protein
VAVVYRAVEGRAGTIVDHELGQFQSGTQAQISTVWPNEGLEHAPACVQQIISSLDPRNLRNRLFKSLSRACHSELDVCDLEEITARLKRLPTRKVKNGLISKPEEL